MGKKGRKDSKSWKKGRGAAQSHLLARLGHCSLELSSCGPLHWVCTRVGLLVLRRGWTRSRVQPHTAELFADTFKKTEALVENPLVSPSGYGR